MLSATPLFTMFNCCKSNKAVSRSTNRQMNLDELIDAKKTQKSYS